MEMFSMEQLVILLTAVAGSGAMVGIMAWVYMRIKQLEVGGGSGGVVELAKLTAQVELLRDELRETRNEIGELREHAEFNARLLVKGPDEP